MEEVPDNQEEPEQNIIAHLVEREGGMGSFLPQIATINDARRQIRIWSLCYYAAEASYCIDNVWFTPSRFLRTGDVFTAKSEHLSLVPVVLEAWGKINKLFLKYLRDKNREAEQEFDPVLDEFFKTTRWYPVRNLRDKVLGSELRSDGTGFEQQDRIEGDKSIDRDIPKHSAASIPPIRAAAERNNADAQLYLGLLYATGNGVAEDVEAAAHWFRKAALQGNTKAQCMLAESYHQGVGTAKNQEEAIAWLNVAAAAGDGDAQRRLEGLPDSLRIFMTSRAQRRIEAITAEIKATQERQQ